MNYQFDIQRPIQESVKEIALQIVEDAISECTSEDLEHHEIIHSVRKKCKRIRGLLGIVRLNLGLTYKKENVFFRDLGRTLSEARDRQVLMELFDNYCKVPDHLSSIIANIKESNKSLDTKTLIENFKQKIAVSKDKIYKWEIKFDGFQCLTGGIKKTYRSGKRAMQVAHISPTSENYHEWRKRAKYHYYHLELLTQIWPAVISPYVEEAHQLSEMLGKDHDLCLLKENVKSNAELNISEEILSQILSTINSEQIDLRLKIKTLGQKIYAELPKNLIIRLENYWNSSLVGQPT